MSILIKGMKMPEECCVCDFMVNGMRCSALKFCDVDDAILRGERYADCPLIELPDHGDLIDRDDLVRKAAFVMDDCTGYCGYAVWHGDIAKLPAVIPAERSEECGI